MRRAFWTSVALGMTGLACAGTSGLRSPFAFRPVIRLTGVEVVDVSFTDMALLAHIQVENPSARLMTLPAPTWALTVSDAAPLQGAASAAVVVEPEAAVDVAVPIAFHFSDVLRSGAKLGGGKGIPYTLTLAMAPNGSALEHHGTLSVPVAPVVRLAAVHVRQLTWREATVQCDVLVEPSGGGMRELRSLDCALELDGRPILQTAADGLGVPLSAGARIPLTAHVPLGGAAQATAAILARREASFRLMGHAIIETADFGVLRLPIDRSGVIPLQPPGAAVR